MFAESNTTNHTFIQRKKIK